MIVSPNTPTTNWIRDNGTTVEASTGLLVDELGDFLVDEDGNNLLDSVSSDGVQTPASWGQEDENTTAWSNSLEGMVEEAFRTTQSGDTRVTASGDTRISRYAETDQVATTAWAGDEEETTAWADSFGTPGFALSIRVTESGDTRVTAQGDTRVAGQSAYTKQTPTSWLEEYA